jgi:hypothetical protein
LQLRPRKGVRLFRVCRDAVDELGDVTNDMALPHLIPQHRCQQTQHVVHRPRRPRLAALASGRGQPAGTQCGDEVVVVPFGQVLHLDVAEFSQRRRQVHPMSVQRRGFEAMFGR